MKHIYSCFILKAMVRSLYSEIENWNKKNPDNIVDILKIDEHYMDDPTDPGKNMYEVAIKCDPEAVKLMHNRIFKKKDLNRCYGFIKRPDTYKPTTYWERISKQPIKKGDKYGQFRRSR